MPYITLHCYCSFSESCLILCNPMDCSMPGFPVLHRLSELAQTHVHWVGDAIQPSCPLSSPSPSGFNLSQHQGLFQWVGSSIRWPKYWSFSLSISPSNEYSGLISFRIDWFDLLAVQGTLKASVLQCLAFFIVQGTLKRVFPSITVQWHQFFSAQPFLFYSSHMCTWLLEKP